MQFSYAVTENQTHGIKQQRYVARTLPSHRQTTCVVAYTLNLWTDEVPPANLLPRY